MPLLAASAKTHSERNANARKTSTGSVADFLRPLVDVGFVALEHGAAKAHGSLVVDANEDESLDYQRKFKPYR